LYIHFDRRRSLTIIYEMHEAESTLYARYRALATLASTGFADH
jgi:hypothetical protein